MEEKIDWVDCRIGIDSEGRFKLECPCKDDYPKALGYLIRMSLETTKGLLIDEANKKGDSNESTDDSE